MDWIPLAKLQPIMDTKTISNPIRKLFLIYYFSSTDCNGHCSSCTGDWTCGKCNNYYRVDDETSISCIGKP